MTPQDYFNIALLVFAAALIPLIAAIVIRSKAKEIRFKAEAEKADLESRLDDAYRNAPNPDLGEVTFRIKDEYFKCRVQAVFPTLEGTMPITIKEFMKDYDDDGYALREAQYLLQTLNEK